MPQTTLYGNLKQQGPLGFAHMPVCALQLGMPNITFSVCLVRTIFCGAPGAQRLDLWGLHQMGHPGNVTEPVSDADEHWAEHKKIQFVQSTSLHVSWALTLWNALTGRRLVFASAFFFAGAVSSIAVSATPAQSTMCSLGDAELPAASCQEFINYKNRSSACALRQHVVSRSLMVCVYTTADSTGVCCALQGDKEMSVNSRVRLSTAYAKTSCFHHAREGPMLWGHFTGVMSRIPWGRCTGIPAKFRGFIFCLRGSWPTFHCWGQWKQRQTWARLYNEGLSNMALGAPQHLQPRKGCLPGFHIQQIAGKSRWLAQRQPA